MARKSALQKIEAHEKLCRIMQKQTFDQIKEMKERIKRIEGEKRAAIADEGITELKEFVDSLITIPNEKLKDVLGGETTFKNCFGSANDVLSGSVQGIAELITRPGIINVDIADVS